MKRITSHPANKKFLLEKFGEKPPPKKFHPFGMPPINFLGSDGFPFEIEVVWDSKLPIHKTREVYHPPHERFIEYTPEELATLRANGIGAVETVDEGPLFYIVALDMLRIFTEFSMPVFEPRRSFLATYTV